MHTPVRTGGRAVSRQLASRAGAGAKRLYAGGAAGRSAERSGAATGGGGPAGLPRPVALLRTSRSTPVSPQRLSFQVHLTRSSADKPRSGYTNRDRWPAFTGL